MGCWFKGGGGGLVLAAVVEVRVVEVGRAVDMRRIWFFLSLRSMFVWAKVLEIDGWGRKMLVEK